MRFLLLLSALLFAAFAFAACGSDDDGDGNGDAPGVESPVGDATEPPDDGDDGDGAPTEPPSFSLPGTPVRAELTSSYGPEDELPVALGTVVAAWYQSEGFYVVHYDGLDLAVSGPVCPGNSIETTTGFEHISNAPVGPGACTGAETLAAPPTGIRLCDGEVLYLTAIPVETVGTLYGTLERFLDDGTIAGVTSMAAADSAAAPEADLSSCTAPEA